MINTKAIRDRILLLALKGELVEQKPQDAPALDLINKLCKKIADKSFEPDFSEDEVPYNVPSSWSWCRLSDIGSTNIGLTYHPEDVTENGIIVARSSNIVNGKMDYSDLVKVSCNIRENQYLNNNDILICARNGSKALVGKCAIYEGDSQTIAFGAFMAVFRTPLFRYVYYYFNTDVFKRNFISDDSKQINQVTQNILKQSLIPVPPLEEQGRIVERIEAIFEILDKIDALQDQYASNQEVLKSKLIEAAIQGKLTEQLPEDGTAEELFEEIAEEKRELVKAKKIKKEKALPPITENEIPFGIPGNWKWVRLSDISYRIWAGGDKPEDFSKESDDVRKVPVVANGVSNEGILGYTSNATATKNTITVAGRGTIGFTVLRRYDYCPIVRLIVIEQSRFIEPRYLQIFLQSMPEASVGSSIPQLTVPMIKPKLVPLPPLNEQLRIYERLSGLLEVISESNQ